MIRKRWMDWDFAQLLSVLVERVLVCFVRSRRLLVLGRENGSAFCQKTPATATAGAHSN